MAANTFNHSLRVLFVASNINESQDLLTLLYNLSPAKRTESALIRNSALGVEPQYLLRDRGGPAIKDLVFMSEDISSGLALSVVFLATYENSDQCAFACPFPTKHGNFYIDLDAFYLVSRDFYFANFTFVALLYLCNHQLCIQVPCHEEKRAERLYHLFVVQTEWIPNVFHSNLVKSLAVTLLKDQSLVLPRV